METIKGLVALLLVAAAVFIVCGMSDLKSQERYAVKVKNDIIAPPTAVVKHTTTQQTAKFDKGKTNVVARQKGNNQKL